MMPTSSSWTPSPALFRGLLLAALIPFAAVVGARWNEPPSAVEGDYAQYLLHAKAIAEGRPYSDIGYIYSQHEPGGAPTATSRLASGSVAVRCRIRTAFTRHQGPDGAARRCIRRDGGGLRRASLRERWLESSPLASFRWRWRPSTPPARRSRILCSACSSGSPCW